MEFCGPKKRLKLFYLWWIAIAFSALTLLVYRQEEHRSVKNWVMRCWHSYLSGDANDLHTVHLCHWHPIISCFIEIENGLIFLVPAYPGCPGKETVKLVCAGVVTNSYPFGGTSVSEWVSIIIVPSLPSGVSGGSKMDVIRWMILCGWHRWFSSVLYRNQTPVVVHPYIDNRTPIGYPWRHVTKYSNRSATSGVWIST